MRDADCPLHWDYKLLPITYYLLPITYYPLPLDSTRLGNPSRVVRITRAFAFMVALMEEEEEDMCYKGFHFHGGVATRGLLR